MAHIKLPSYTKGEEIWSSVSHGVGAALSIAGLVLLLIFSSGDGWKIASSLVFGISLILLYTMSTLYHALTHPAAKRVMRILDHSMIFLLIAGTYTPFTLVSLHGRTGWTVFGVIWAAAVVGILLNAIDMERFKRASLICYLAMGWQIVFAIKPMLESVRTEGLLLLLAGGLFYTGGVVFYVLKRYKFFHSIWHMFVVAGSVLHYFSILFYVIL